MTEGIAPFVRDTVKMVRHLVGQLWPDDMPLYELTLGQLSYWPSSWHTLPPKQWQAKDLLMQASREGYCSPGIIPDVTPPWCRFVMVVASVSEHFRRAGCSTPKEDDVKAVYRDFGLNAELSDQLLDTAEQAAVELVLSGIRETDSPLGTQKRYVVYEGTARYALEKEEELGRFRQEGKKKRYDIFVDDLQSVILVKGNKVTLKAGETGNFSLLKCLLRRVGNHWTHQELFEELNLPDATDKRIRKVVDNECRILLHRMLEAIRQSLGTLVGEKKAKEWFDSSQSKRIVVSSKLNSCLIEYMR